VVETEVAGKVVAALEAQKEVTWEEATGVAGG
jgi:hypothetical protein